ncbi:MAG: hypothetical protein KH188_10955, partial [Prevotella sp.]|nr:hypothetical protein [Prevotella sp.]
MKKRVYKRPLTEVVAQCAQPLLVEGSKTEDLGITNKPATNTDPLLALKSATKPFNVLLACTRPLITELSDKLRLIHPL